jgi:hypothetical protein
MCVCVCVCVYVCVCVCVCAPVREYVCELYTLYAPELNSLVLDVVQTNLSLRERIKAYAGERGVRRPASQVDLGPRHRKARHSSR